MLVKTLAPTVLLLYYALWFWTMRPFLVSALLEAEELSRAEEERQAAVLELQDGGDKFRCARKVDVVFMIGLSDILPTSCCPLDFSLVRTGVP